MQGFLPLLIFRNRVLQVAQASSSASRVLEFQLCTMVLYVHFLKIILAGSWSNYMKYCISLI